MRAASPATPTVALPAPAPGFVWLYNGRDLTGWEVQDGRAAAWKAAGETISCISSGGGWLRSAGQYSDFELAFDFRLSPGANTGVGFRFPPLGDPSASGFEIQLIDDAAEKYRAIRPNQRTGSVYYNVAPSLPAPLNAAGEWNRCFLRCAGQKIEVRINDVVVNTVQIDAEQPGTPKRSLASRPQIGHIGLQSSSAPADFRNIQIRDLSSATNSGVRYYDIVAGQGEAIASDSIVRVHFRGHLTDGKLFTSSFEQKEPVRVALNEVVTGWKDGMSGMKVGGRRKLVVPPGLAYGEKGYGTAVPPNSTLIYEIQLEAQEPTASPPAPTQPPIAPPPPAPPANPK
jgi:hypothetical protein